MRDLFGDELAKIRYLESKFRNVVERAGYSEIVTPIVEDVKLFTLKGGEEIRRTIYVFKDKAEREIALRPEFTPSVARVYLNYFQHYPKPIRFYYIGTVYRYDEPQFGRYREFRQAGVELLGSESILADIEMLQLLIEFFSEINLYNKIKIKINNIAIFKEILNRNKVNEEDQEHFLHLVDKNKVNEALEYLKSKNINEIDLEIIQNMLINKLEYKNYNKLVEYIREKKRDNLLPHIERLFNIVNIMNNLGYSDIIEVDIGFVRGLAYYTGIIFEVTHPEVSFSIAGGGRYDELIKLYSGNENLPAIGFAIGLERTSMLIKDSYKQNTASVKIGMIIINENEKIVSYALNVLSLLRKQNLSVILNLKDSNISKLISFYANLNFDYLIIIGNKEFENKTVIIKNLKTRQQIELPFDKISEISTRVV
ncbi:MAG: histidine--tRNA ligase [Sulfolobaceae archaeon]